MNSIKLYSLFVLSALSVSVPLCASSDLSNIEEPKTVDARSYHARFCKQTYTNASARFFSQDYSLTTLDFAGNTESADVHRIAPLGKENRFWGFHADSYFIIDDHNRVWGKAAYTRGERKDVQWSETSDYEMLYPYVMADEKGGSMDYEQYDLSGGYAGRYGAWIFGTSLGYRARSEYRTKDPRPNNTVADLQTQLSGGRVWGTYALTASFRAGKYKQTNELQFFNELGALKEYHLTGIGNEFVRFSGASNNVFYKGHHLGGSMELVPLSRKGLSLSVLYNQFSFDKVLSNLNRLALNHLQEDKVITEVAWTGRSVRKAYYGVKLQADYSQRRGHDNMFGDATGNVYPQIGRTLMYRNSCTNSVLTAFYERPYASGFSWGLSPRLGYSHYESRHTASGNIFDTDNLTWGTSVQGGFQKKKHFTQLKLASFGRVGTSTDIQLDPEMIAHPSLAASLMQTAEYFEKNEWNTRLSWYYQYQLRPHAMSCFLDFSWSHSRYLSNRHADTFFLTAGIHL